MSPRSSTHRSSQGKSSYRKRSPIDSISPDEVITFRKYLKHDEAQKLDRRMDENTSHLDCLETKLMELDAIVERRKRKVKGRSRDGKY